MRKCDDCKMILDSDVRHCPQCGKQVADGQSSDTSSNLEVGALLTSANLNRIKQQWDAAIDDASAALKLEPRNADIASLIGSIYEQRGMPEEAAIWYQMALDMNPDSDADRVRLQRVKEQTTGRAKPRVGRRNRYWVWAGLAAAALLLIVSISWSLLTGDRSEQPQPKTGAGSTSTRANAARNYTASAPPSEPPAGVKPEAPSGAASSGSVRTPAEALIRSEIAGSEAVQQSRAQVDDVIADPRDNVAVVTFSLPSGVSVTRAQVITAADAVAQAAFAANAQVKYVTARCLMATQGVSGTQMLFVGDVERNSLMNMSQNATPQQLEAVFTRAWWNPSLGPQP